MQRVLAGSATLIASVVLLTALTRQSQSELEFIPVAGGQAPYSAAVRVGRMLYVSGQLGFDGTLTGAEGARAATREALTAVRRIVEGNGGDMQRVARCTVFLAGAADWDAVNQEYTSHFPGPRPSRVALRAVGLPRDARVEVECEAVLR